MGAAYEAGLVRDALGRVEDFTGSSWYPGTAMMCTAIATQTFELDSL